MDVPAPEGLLRSWSLGEALPRPELNATAGIGENGYQSGECIPHPFADLGGEWKAVWGVQLSPPTLPNPDRESSQQASSVTEKSCEGEVDGTDGLLPPAHLHIWQRRTSVPVDSWLSVPAPAPCVQ